MPKLADHIVATSQHIAAELARDGMPKERVTVVGNGIEDAFVAGPGAREPARRDRRANRLRRQSRRLSGIDTLLEAFALVAKARPDARLVLLTDLPSTASVPWPSGSASRSGSISSRRRRCRRSVNVLPLLRCSSIRAPSAPATR
ncbi:MAG: hypothetical protein R3C69_13145 [Geminicoccaceae bacterium]